MFRFLNRGAPAIESKILVILALRFGKKRPTRFL
jgi:hypothetical protein